MASYDVCVLGAGLSGLSCARRILSARPSACIIVLEARDRVGGRTLSVQVGDDAIDLGGQWVGPAQPKCLQLISELNLSTVKQQWFDEGAPPAADANNFSSGSSVPLTDEEDSELRAIAVQLESWAASVRDPASWESCPQATEWDAMSVAEYFDGAVKSTAVRRELDLLVRTVTASEPTDLSFFYFLFFLGACGGLSGKCAGCWQWRVCTQGLGAPAGVAATAGPQGHTLVSQPTCIPVAHRARAIPSSTVPHAQHCIQVSHRRAIPSYRMTSVVNVGLHPHAQWGLPPLSTFHRGRPGRSCVLSPKAHCSNEPHACTVHTNHGMLPNPYSLYGGMQALAARW